MNGSSVEREDVLRAGAHGGDRTRLREVPSFAENIARVRREKKLSQSQVSSRSGIHVTEVSRIERGLRDPRLSTIIRFARALEVEPGSLLETTASERT
jgi:transcriptional regulator with XRE-family HTH domain